MATQVKLLRVIQEREYERVGSNRTMQADVRIIAATNRNLEEAVQDGTFREDLYYRINVFPLHLPPLRNRRSDILLLANHFAQRYARQARREVRRISTSAINLLMSYHWPGNIRELENCMAHAVLMCNDGIIHGRHFPPTLQAPQRLSHQAVGTLKSRVEMLERDMIIDALKRNNGSIAAASTELGITSRMVRYKIEKMDIDYEQLFKRRRRGRKRSSDNST
jgi:Nif-specific regulatory protein